MQELTPNAKLAVGAKARAVANDTHFFEEGTPIVLDEIAMILGAPFYIFRGRTNIRGHIDEDNTQFLVESDFVLEEDNVAAD